MYSGRDFAWLYDRCDQLSFSPAVSRDLDENGEGQRAARALARQAVLRGVGVHTMDVDAYGGYPEPSAQWEAEGCVTLDLDLELCRECKSPVHYYAPDGAYCEIHGPGL